MITVTVFVLFIVTDQLLLLVTQRHHIHILILFLIVGIVSGNDEPKKFEKAGFHATKSTFVDAPLIDELPMAVECQLISYDPESCRLVGRIVNVSADESVLGANGKVDPPKLQPITYDPMNHHYPFFYIYSLILCSRRPTANQVVS